jgi:hypothetical protein
MISLPSLLQHIFILGDPQLTFSSLKYKLKCSQNIIKIHFYFWLHVSATQDHLHGTYFGGSYCTVLDFSVLRTSFLFLSSYCGVSVPLRVCRSPSRVFLVLQCNMMLKYNIKPL